MDRKEAEEAWLHAQVGPAFDALKADPGRAVTADQVRARLADIAQAIERVRRVDAGLKSPTHFDPAEELITAEAVAAFLADAEATADPVYIEHAHQVAARARTMHGIAS
ncbi:transcriptional regulator [Paracidovorax citrulli]|nr:transcriptional regulator [Paracidovorax citrulli]UEG44670.1 transcriptional regulator [Paracidovorax citrulli]